MGIDFGPAGKGIGIGIGMIGMGIGLRFLNDTVKDFKKRNVPRYKPAFKPMKKWRW